MGINPTEVVQSNNTSDLFNSDFPNFSSLSDSETRKEVKQTVKSVYENVKQNSFQDAPQDTIWTPYGGIPVDRRAASEFSDKTIETTKKYIKKVDDKVEGFFKDAPRDSLWTPYGGIPIDDRSSSPEPVSEVETADDLSLSENNITIKLAEKAVFKGGVAAPLQVLLCQPAVVANKKVQMGMKALPKEYLIWATIPKNFRTFYAGWSTAIIGKTPSQFTLLGSNEVFKSILKDHMDLDSATAVSAFLACMAQQGVKAPFTFIEHMQHQNPELKFGEILAKEHAALGTTGLLEKLYSGMGPKLFAESVWFPSYMILSQKYVNDEDSAMMKTIKSGLIGGVSSALSYPMVRMQTQSMLNAQVDPKTATLMRSFVELCREGQALAKNENGTLTRAIAQGKPFYRGGVVGISAIMPLQAISMLLINEMSKVVFSDPD